jgi:hypothetical protein
LARRLLEYAVQVERRLRGLIREGLLTLEIS